MLPVESRVDHETTRNIWGAVVRIRGSGSRVVAMDGIVPLERAGDGEGVRIDQQLRRIAPVPSIGVVGTVHSVSICRARPGIDNGGSPVAPAPRRLCQRDRGGFARISTIGEKTQIDRRGPRRRDGKPDDATVPYRTEGGGGGGGALDRAVRQ